MRIGALLLAGVLSCTLLAGCKDKGEESGTENNAYVSDSKENMTIFQVDARALEEPSWGEENPMLQKAASGANDFAFELSKNLVKKDKKENFICSPYSAWLPLAALVNGTEEAQKEALLQALQVPGMKEEDLNRAVSQMLYQLTRERAQQLAKETGEEIHIPLKIANAIFVGNNVTLDGDFAQTFMDYYRGESINVNFASKEAVREINKWASEHTEGLIDNIVEGFDPNTVSAIANAIYFSDRWQGEFDPKQTSEDVFHGTKGKKTASFMLREGDHMNYYEDDTLQAMPLSFKSGTGGSGMYILLPKNGDGVGLLSSMTNEYFQEIDNGVEKRKGKLLLPRFSIESDTMSLKESLEAIGVSLFDEKEAPLDKVIEEPSPLWVSDAVQKAAIKVDEKGTTAAAVTVIMMDTKSAEAERIEPEEPFEMICNKPFVFALYDNVAGAGKQVLFTGVVNQP